MSQKALLDTNILIHRETKTVIRDDIGSLFRWLDVLKYEKCIHPLSVEEIRNFQDEIVVKSFEAKISSYYQLKTKAPRSETIKQIAEKWDVNKNDDIDTSLLNEVFANRVDILITEDRKLHRKAEEAGIETRVFTIDSSLEKANAENPSLQDYKVLSVKKEYFGNININDDFFTSFKEDYPGFEDWFNRKSEEEAYVCKGDDDKILAFLYLKSEDESEDYSDINPTLDKKKRLKIGTFKVVSNGFKIGERFLKIIFDNAVLTQPEEIYVTIFNKSPDQKRLIELLSDWGFSLHGEKTTSTGNELVLIRKLSPAFDNKDPRVSFPFISKKQQKLIVPIYPEYHTELFPDSILNTESPSDFIEHKPNRNAISKVYISRSIYRDINPGDVIIFYRTKSGGSAWYTSVATTIGVVQNIITKIDSCEDFIELCRKRSVFSDEELKKHWNYNRRYRPFIVNFLYTYSFPRRPNMKTLVENGIIAEAPRGFEPLSDEGFDKLLEVSNADRRIIID